MKEHTIPREFYDQIAPELLAGESLLWAGKPRGGHGPAAPSRILTLTIVIFFVLATLVATFVALRGMLLIARLMPFLLIIAVLLLVGVLALSRRGMPAARQARRRAAPLYAITSRRVMILTGSAVLSYSASDIDFIERRMHPDGTGDILFKRELQPRKETSPEQQTVADVGLYGVENPREVEALMLEVFRPASTVYEQDQRDAWVYEDELDTTQDRRAAR